MLLSELLYPIDVHETIDKFEIGSILDLLFFKNNINYYRNYFLKGRISTKPHLFEILHASDFRSHVVDALSENDDFFVFLILIKDLIYRWQYVT